MKRDAAWTFILLTIAILIGFTSETYAQVVLYGTVTGCQRDAFGAAAGPDRPLPGVRVLVGQSMNFETGLTGIDNIRNPKGVSGDTLTDSRGNFTVTLPRPGTYEVILWKAGYVTEIKSQVPTGVAFNGSICNNIMAPATHQELAPFGGPPIEKPVEPSPATYAQVVLSGTVTGCQRDAFGAASGPNRPLPGVRVLVGQYMNYETGLTGVDFIRNPKGVSGDTSTNVQGNFTVTLPRPGVYEVILWKKGYVTEIASKFGIGTATTFHGSICDNIMAPATHQELAFIGGPPSEKPVVIWKNGNDGGIEGGNGTPPKVSLDRAYYITEIYTYHWNGGQGQPIAGTIALRGADGTTYGPWQAEIYNKVYWRAIPNAIIPAGTYALIDSDPKTWAQNNGSKGTGQGWASGTPAKDEKPGLTDPSKSADGTTTVSPSPSSESSVSDVAEWGAFHLSYTIAGANLEPRETITLKGGVDTYHYTGKLAGNTLTISGKGWGDNPVSAPNYPWVVSASVSVDGKTQEFEYKAITPGEKLNKSFSLSVPIPANASSGSISMKVLYYSAYRIQGNVVTGTFTRREMQNP